MRIILVSKSVIQILQAEAETRNKRGNFVDPGSGESKVPGKRETYFKHLLQICFRSAGWCIGYYWNDSLTDFLSRSLWF